MQLTYSEIMYIAMFADIFLFFFFSFLTLPAGNYIAMCADVKRTHADDEPRFRYRV